MMSILKAHSKAEMQKFTGVFVPQCIFSYISLYILAKGISRSDLLRNMMEKWVEETKSQTQDKELIQDILHKVRLQWKLEKSLTPGLQLFVYKKKLEKELTSKGVEAGTVAIILNELE